MSECGVKSATEIVQRMEEDTLFQNNTNTLLVEVETSSPYGIVTESSSYVKYAYLVVQVEKRKDNYFRAPGRDGFGTSP